MHMYKIANDILYCQHSGNALRAELFLFEAMAKTCECGAIELGAKKPHMAMCSCMLRTCSLGSRASE